MTLGEIITTGLNNPECAFFVGQTFGTFLVFKIAIGLAIINWIYKAMDVLAFEPFINWIKKRFRKTE